MPWRLGPSVLLRLATAISLGLALLLTGCAPGAPDKPQGAAMKDREGWRRGKRDHSVTLTAASFPR